MNIGGVIVAAYLTRDDMSALVYAITTGFGVGISFMPPIIAAWERFPNSKGVIAGFLMAANGISGFLYAIVAYGE